MNIMTRKQFIQITIIAPIATFFGFKKVVKEGKAIKLIINSDLYKLIAMGGIDNGVWMRDKRPIFETACFDEQLNQSDRERVISYLKEKYRIKD